MARRGCVKSGLKSLVKGAEQKQDIVCQAAREITSSSSLDIQVTANWLLKAEASAYCIKISETRTHLSSTIRRSLLWPFVSAVLVEWQPFMPHEEVSSVRVQRWFMKLDHGEASEEKQAR